MYSFSLSAAALALAASAALAPTGGQPGAEREIQPTAGQRGAPPGSDNPGKSREQPGRAARSGESRPPAIELRPLRDIEPEAQRVVSEILSNPDRRESRDLPQAAAERARGALRGDTPLRDAVTPGGTERVLQRVISGPLDRSARMIRRCPPGLARKGGCEPPGQRRASSRQSDSLLGSSYSPLLFGLTGFDAGRYLYQDGYLMQLADGLGDSSGIAGYIPLLGGALASGNIWPNGYGSQTVPAYLVDFYNLGEPGSYRYADNTLYRVDPQSAAIQSVAALLADEEVVIGKPMPAGYDVYNVPQPFRSRYADSAEAAYRYVDGYVYRLDPETRLVTAAIDLLT